MENTQHKQLSNGNISDYIFSYAEQFPDKKAIIHPYPLSYKRFQNEIDRFVYGFKRIGVKKGQRVLMLVKPGPTMFIITFSILRIGAIPVLIDPGMGPKAMIRALSKIHIDVFIGEPKAHVLRLLYPTAFKKVSFFISTGNFRLLKGYSLSDIRSTKLERSKPVTMKPSDEAAIFFTSGSTGPAKAVLYRNSMLDAQVKLLQSHFKYKAGEIDCCTFPLTSLLVMCLGLSIVFADMNMTKPAQLKPKKLIKNLQEYKCTHLFCSSMVLRKLAEYGKNKNIKLPSLKQVMTAGAIVPGDLLSDFRELLEDDATIHTPYGATEALPVSDINDKELLELYSETNNPNRSICVGYPLVGIEIKIIKIDDNEISDLSQSAELIDNEVGEIVVRGNVVTQEYLSLENRHYSKIWDSKHNIYWHKMGDLGKKDQKGRIWYYGRKTQRVITKDSILFTVPVESIFNIHPKVMRSALVGISQADTEFKLPVVCIQLKESANNKEKKQIIDQLNDMAKSENIRIRKFVFIKNFPVDPRHNAKIYREKLAKWVKL